jgi:hypothetical protein
MKASPRHESALQMKQTKRHVSKALFYNEKKEMTMKPLIGYEWPEGRSKQVAYISQDHHIHEFSVSMGGTWQHADLTKLSSAPLASSRFLLGYAWPEWT